MPPKPNPSSPDHRRRPPPPPVAIEIQLSSPRYPLTTTHTTTRKIAIAVDLSDDSAFAVHWAVLNYLRPGDSVTILHVRPTSILYGADWGSTHFSDDTVNHHQHQHRSTDSDNKENRRRLEEEFDVLTEGKIREIARPLVEARVPFRVHIVKDHDMKERLCLEIERFPEREEGADGVDGGGGGGGLSAVVEEETEYHDATEERRVVETTEE